MIIDKRMVWNIYWADPPDPLGKATNICVDTRRVSTTQTPAYDSNLQVHFHDNLWGWRVDGRWKISTWTNLAGSELRGQSSGPPPSPVQASEPVWPLKPSNERRQSIYYIGQIFKLTTCPAQSIEVSSRKLFPSLAACQGWNWFLSKLLAVKIMLSMGDQWWTGKYKRIISHLKFCLAGGMGNQRNSHLDVW